MIRAAASARLTRVPAFLVGIPAFVVLILASASFGQDTLQAEPPAVADRLAEGDQPAGRWRKFNAIAPPSETGQLSSEQIESILALGYLSGSRAAPDASGVTVHDPGRACDGLNLVVSGHAPEAYLMKMDGTVVHHWSKSFDEVWGTVPESPEGAYRGRQYWRRAHLFENGDLLVIFDGEGIVKLDSRSNVLWAARGGYHHDAHVMPDGSIYTLKRETKLVPRINPKEPIREDFIAVLDAGGLEMKAVSLLECFENSLYAPMLANMKRAGDVFHTNSIEVLDGRHAARSPAFAAGNVLVSVREISVVAVVDLSRGSVAWALTGLWLYQHEPTMLDNGNLLVFDNAGMPERSRVLEIDPLSQSLKWSYGGREEEPLFTFLCGSCQRLKNGSTLITESDNGRAFEVSPDGRVVWEYINPHRAGPKRELIATLFEVVRLPARERFPWLDGIEATGDHREET